MKAYREVELTKTNVEYAVDEMLRAYSLGETLLADAAEWDETAVKIVEGLPVEQRTGSNAQFMAALMLKQGAWKLRQYYSKLHGV